MLICPICGITWIVGPDVCLPGVVCQLTDKGKETQLTMERVISLLIKGEWVELDKPIHEGGEVIKSYTPMEAP